MPQTAPTLPSSCLLFRPCVCARVRARVRQEAVRCVAGAPGGRVVSGSVDRTLRVWAVADGRKLHKLKGHLAPVRAVVALQPGAGGAAVAVSASDDGTVRVWDLDAGALQYALTGAPHPARAPKAPRRPRTHLS